MTAVFTKQKLSCESKMDLSRKGAVDEPIVKLIAFINQSSSYFTTSSCSGRIYVFEDGVEEIQKKKGCRWLYTTHNICDFTSIEAALEKSCGDASIKFEPFVLHVQCCTMEDARIMHEVAVASGFRNSGITVGKRGKIVVAVRSTHTLEAPLTQDGKLLVDSRYIQFTVELACKKLIENFRRIDLFFDRLKKTLHAAENSRSPSTDETTHFLVVGKTKRYQKERKNGINTQNGYATNKDDFSKDNSPKKTADDWTDTDFDSLDNISLFKCDDNSA